MGSAQSLLLVQYSSYFYLEAVKQVDIVAYSRFGVTEQIGIGIFKDLCVSTPWSWNSLSWQDGGTKLYD